MNLDEPLMCGSFDIVLGYLYEWMSAVSFRRRTPFVRIFICCSSIFNESGILSFGPLHIYTFMQKFKSNQSRVGLTIKWTIVLTAVNWNKVADMSLCLRRGTF